MLKLIERALDARLAANLNSSKLFPTFPSAKSRLHCSTEAAAVDCSHSSTTAALDLDDAGAVLLLDPTAVNVDILIDALLRRFDITGTCTANVISKLSSKPALPGKC
jgi:hypothetical protein